MVVIVQNGELTEKKKQKCCEYSKWFKLINRIIKIIEPELEEQNDYMNCTDIGADTVKQINKLLDKLERRKK